VARDGVCRTAPAPPGAQRLVGGVASLRRSVDGGGRCAADGRHAGRHAGVVATAAAAADEALPVCSAGGRRRSVTTPRAAASDRPGGGWGMRLWPSERSVP